MITIDSLKKIRSNENFRGFEGVDGPTPIYLCEEMIDLIPINYKNPDKKWSFPAVGHGTYAIIVYWRYMKGLSEVFIDEKERSRHILENMLYLNEINPFFCLQLRNQGFINIIEGDYVSYEFKMKFDVVIGNPPYQKKVGPRKTEAIWPKFVQKSFDMCKEDGYVSLIHPSGWRNVDGKFKETQNLLLSKNVKFLKMSNTKKGFETFGVNTNFDFYLIQNNNNLSLTKITDYNDNYYELNIREVNFIPNSNINLVYSLVAKDNEERVDVLYSRSSYGTDKSHMSKVRTEEHIYPCVYTVGALNPNFWYSNDNKGHIGLSKVIWGNGLTDIIIDSDGCFGLTQFAYAIVDEPENLQLIKKVLKSEFFIKNIMGYTKGVGHIYDRKIISTFRKDFWRDFLDEDNNVICPNYNVERV